ncbi:MAG: lipoyl synthase [Candidatus Omnitrophica bacterium]|nr:lipoyl synthase [Candidatus Omnitrophota bacterium]
MDNTNSCRQLPVWFKQRVPDQNKINEMKQLLTSVSLHTVCESAQCPNMGQCWGQGVATFMILGDRCTRACKFCAVTSGKPLDVDPEEPLRVAQAIKKLGLKYAVITSVTRDDIPDEGAGQFASTVRNIRMQCPEVKVELLVPDFSGRGGLIEQVISSKPDVIGHNIEMVERLFPSIRPQTKYRRSLDVLQVFKENNDDILVKSGFMIGLGEKRDEIFKTIDDLANVGCNIITIGQYLSPSKTERHVQVKKFYSPEEFEEFKIYGEKKGVGFVLSGPLVRSSFMAEEGYKNVKLG